MWRGRSRAAAGGVAGALVLGATVALLLGSQGRARSWTTVLFAWKPYEAPHNVFDDFDEFKAPKWRDYTAPSNVFDELPELAEADHKVRVLSTRCRFASSPDTRCSVFLLRPVGGQRAQR